MQRSAILHYLIVIRYLTNQPHLTAINSLFPTVIEETVHKGHGCILVGQYQTKLLSFHNLTAGEWANKQRKRILTKKDQA